MRFVAKSAIPILIGLVFGGVAVLDFPVSRALLLRSAPLILLRPGWRLDLAWVEVPYLVSGLFVVFITLLFLGLRLWEVRIKCLLFLLILSTHIFALGSGHLESTSFIVPLFLFVTALDLFMDERVNVSPVFFLMLALLAFAILSLVNGRLPSVVRLLKEMKYFSMFFLIVLNVRDLKHLRFALKAFIVLAVLSAIIGIVQEILFVSVGFELLGNIPEEQKGIFLYQPTDFGILLRVQAFFGVPGVFAAMMAVAGSLVSYLVLSKGPGLFPRRFFLYPALLLLATSAALAFNRPADAALALGALLALYLSRPSYAIHFTAVIVLLPALVSAVFIAKPFLFEQAVAYVQDEIATGDFMGRLTLNRRALIGAVTKHPFAGVGMGLGAIYTQDWKHWPAHSVAIQAAADIGIPGAIVYLSIFVVAFIRLLPVMGSRNPDYQDLAKALVVGFVPLFFHMMNEPFFLKYPLGWIYVGLMESLTLLATRRTTS